MTSSLTGRGLKDLPMRGGVYSSIDGSQNRLQGLP
jgi:hypothetical protein